MLINCKECGREVSDTAKACPHCGAKVKKEKVVRENPQWNNPFKKLVETTTSSAKGKWIYLGTVAGCCAIAFCFLILTILSFAAPSAFLHSKKCRDGYALINHLAPRYNSYEMTIQGKQFEISNLPLSGYVANVCVKSSLSGGSYTVRYRFKSNGEAEAVVTFSVGYRYEVDYEYDGTYPVLIRAYKDSKITTLTSTEMQLAYSILNLTDTVLDYVLSENNKHYNFNDIISDYADYRNSLMGIWVSSTVLAVLFTAISVCGIVIYVIYAKKGVQTVEPLNTESNEVLQE